MTRDDIIRMAREAGIDAWWDSGNECREDLQAHLEHFSGLIAAAEREKCERALNELRGSVSMFATSKEARAHNNAVTCCVEAIRSRGNQ